MQTDTFNRTVYIIFGVLVVAIIGLSIVLFNNGPRVRLIQFDSDPAKTTLTEGSSVTITFDRPLEQKDYQNMISFQPDVDFEAKTSSQNITLRLKENLAHDTDYTLAISKKVLDQSGKPMSDTYKYDFTTTSPRFAFLERNYGLDSEDDLTGSNDEPDNIIIARPNTDAVPDIVFSHPRISDFAINNDYLIAAGFGEDSDQLFIKDLETGEEVEDPLPISGHVRNLSISPQGDIALFTVLPEYSKTDVEFYDNFANSLYRVNLETRETSQLINPLDDKLLKAESVEMDKSGQLALIKTPDQDFYVISPYEEFTPILIGSYVSSFGFYGDSKLLFRTSTDTVMYDTESGETSKIEVDGPGVVQSANSNNGLLHVSIVEYSPGAQDARIIRFDENDKNFEAEVWAKNESESYSLRNIATSNDGELLALQINPRGCSYDSFLGNSQCRDVETIIFDTDTREEVIRYNGFDTVWLP